MAAGVAGLVLLGAPVAALGASPVGAQPPTSLTLYVATTGSDGANDCASQSAPCLTVQHALDEASSSGAVTVTVSVGAGTFYENDLVQMGSGGPSVTIEGSAPITTAFAPPATSICSATLGTPVLTIESGNVSLDQIGICGGNAPNGGGIDDGEVNGLTGGPLTLDNAFLYENSASGNGGGLYAWGQPVVMTNTFWSDDTSGSTNAFDGGGAIYFVGSSLTGSGDDFLGSTLNSAAGDGGCIDLPPLDSATVQLTNETFGCQAGDGGGIFNIGQQLNVSNSTFTPSDLITGPSTDAIDPNLLAANDVVNDAPGDFATSITGSSFSAVTSTDAAQVSNGPGATMTLTRDQMQVSGFGRGPVVANAGTMTAQDLTIGWNGDGALRLGSGGLLNEGMLSATGLSISNMFTNSADASGLTNYGTATVNDSLFSGDSAQGGEGGAVEDNGGQLTMDNDTFFNNVSSNGGALDASGGSAMVRNVTVTSNASAPAIATSGGGSVELMNSILVNPNSCAGTIGDGQYNVESDNSCGFGPSDSVNTPNIDLASSLAANSSNGTQTLAIPPQSSAIGVIPPPSCAGDPTDARGEPRPGLYNHGNTGGCDAGAFEFQGPGTPQNLSATASGSQVQLTWSTPAGGDLGLVNGFHVFEGTAAGQEDYGQPLTGDGYVASPTFTVGNLTPGTAYYFTVDAVNSAGQGAPSSEVEAGLTTIAVSSSADPSAYGQPVTFTATISPAVPGGTVSFTDGSSAIAGCAAVPVTPGGTQATCTTSDLPVGNSAIEASYSGTGGLSSSSGSLPGGQTVQPAPTTLVATSAKGTGVDPTLSATLTSAVTGSPIAGQTVVFTGGPKSVTLCSAVTSPAGVAQCKVPASKLLSMLMQNTYTASFAGTIDYLPSQATAPY